MTPEQQAIIEAAKPKKGDLCGDRSERVVRLMNSQAGAALYDYVHIDKLCAIIVALEEAREEEFMEGYGCGANGVVQ